MSENERSARVVRRTAETEIELEFAVSGTGAGRIETGIPFMDHMLTLFSKHGFFDLSVKAHGDLEVDCHHTMEDLGLVFGSAISEALGDKRGIRRYGSMLLPMDETLVMIALDLSGRPGLYYDVRPPAPYVGELDARLFHEFFQALCGNCGMNLHIRQIAAEETHHLFEAIFKGFAKALDQATTIDPRIDGVFSTKGVL